MLMILKNLEAVVALGLGEGATLLRPAVAKVLALIGDLLELIRKEGHIEPPHTNLLQGVEHVIRGFGYVVLKGLDEKDAILLGVADLMTNLAPEIKNELLAQKMTDAADAIMDNVVKHRK